MSNTTSDGISLSDWDKLGDLAADLANEESDIQCEAIRKKILIYLNGLTKKYGNRASIFATKSDYVKPLLMKERLLLFSYDLTEDGDLKNKTMISSSLADLYIDEQENYAKGHHWLDVLEENLKNYFDKHENSNFERLKVELQKIKKS